jgi:hypothetical protein
MTFGVVSVRFKHPTMDLTFLSSVLEMPCFRSWTVGDLRQTPRGDLLTGVYKESYWVSRLEYPINNEVGGFKEQLMLAIDRLAKVQKTLRDLKASSGTIEIYLQLPGSINNGDTIDLPLLKKLVELEIDLSIEVFPGM